MVDALDEDEAHQMREGRHHQPGPELPAREQQEAEELQRFGNGEGDRQRQQDQRRRQGGDGFLQPAHDPQCREPAQ